MRRYREEMTAMSPLSRPGDPGDVRFQNWLKRELDARDWSQAKLARELDVFKGTVGRWLMPPDHPMFRRPAFESCRRLAELFGVELRYVLDLAGIEGYDNEENLTRLQRDTIALVSHIPDDLLAGVYAQLRGLIDENVQEMIRAQMKGGSRGGGEVSAVAEEPTSGTFPVGS
jgi:transcriptional regulator with XRE-family HTH domain